MPLQFFITVHSARAAGPDLRGTQGAAAAGRWVFWLLANPELTIMILSSKKNGDLVRSTTHPGARAELLRASTPTS